MTTYSTTSWHTTSTPAPAWQESKRAADVHFQQVAAILSGLGFTSVTPTSEWADIAGVDILTSEGPVAWRCRDAHYMKFQDITVRVSRPSGAPTEADKLRAGAVRWCLWTWTDGGKVTAWALLRADRVALLLGLPWATKQMSDATFACIPLSALRAINAIVACEGLEIT